jgi:hypothetical protein
VNKHDLSLLISEGNCPWPECGCKDGCAVEELQRRAAGICNECNYPQDSEPHLNHCPEAIMG